LWLTAVGIGLGLPAALLGSRTIDALVFGVGARDPLTIAAAIALILLATLAACLLPARRAARIDPMTALRCE
jgi:ABC-type antimicrobial peptide transport system permease subunit